MRKLKSLSLCLIALVAIFSCTPEETNTNTGTGTSTGGIYVINYGSYSGDKSTLTSYDEDLMQTTQGVYETANAGNTMTSNAQYAALINDHIYFMGNSGDQVFDVDANTLEQTENGISDLIVKPRYCVADGNYLYVSCWGGDVWTDVNLSYIAKINITTREVEDTISMPGGPEGLVISNGKLFAALNYANGISVMDLATQEISTIEISAVSSYLIKDDEGNIYATAISSYSNPSDETGLVYIDGESASVINTIPLEGVSGEYGSTLAFNSDKSKLYVVAASYNADWVMEGGVQVMDVATQTFDESPVVTGIVGIGGVCVNNENDDIYVLIGESTSANGKMRVLNSAGDSLTTVETGISPKWMVFVD